MIKQIVPEAICLACFGCCRFKERDSVWGLKLLEQEAVSLGESVRQIDDPEGCGLICASLDILSNRCAIYSRRPFDCQLYPFLLNRKGQNVFLAVDLNCPYALKNLDSQAFKDYINDLELFLNSQEQLGVLRKNPRLIQAYKEAQDLVALDI